MKITKTKKEDKLKKEYWLIRRLKVKCTRKPI